ncbi:MAG: NAD(P)H-binding protein [Deltaproteobacteria bacterium]|nr:MAG: NAD(P)H-binding protein [Deltaproteobacteria bacterium]
MKLLGFGSTGGTGRELLKQALDQGYNVVAFARNPCTIDNIKYANLQVVQGDVLDPAVVESASADH